MQVKSQRLVKSPSSKIVLKQLEENQSLRIEIFRLRTDLRDQHHHIINSTVNQQMFVEKILTELSLAFRRGREAKQQKQQLQIFCSAVSHCVGDLKCLLQTYEQFKSQWSHTKHDDPAIHYERLLQQCASRFDRAEEVIEKISLERDRSMKDNQIKLERIQFLQNQLSKLSKKYQQSQIVHQRHNEQKGRLSAKLKQNQYKINGYCQKIENLKKANDSLSTQIRQSQQIVKRHAQYLQNKYENIEKENHRLIQMQRQFLTKEQQLNESLERKHKQNELLQEQCKRLKNKAQGLEVKLKDIIEKQNKIKHLEILKHHKFQNKIPLSQIQTNNSISVTDEKCIKRQVGKMTKKFNLQSFQQKLSSQNSIHSH